MSPDVLTQLRTYATHLDDRAPSLEELIPVTTAPRRSPPWQPRRRRWVAAVMAAVVLVILIGGLALLTNRAGNEDVIIDQPTPTTTPTIPPTTSPPPPTTIPAALDAKITTLAYTDVPSFTGSVQYYEHDPTSGDVGWQATVAVSFAGPMQYEVEVIEEEGEYLFLGGAGKVFLGDGTATWLNEFEDMPLAFVSGFDHFRHFYYDSDWPSPPWDETCAEGAELLGTEPLLGRTATHVSCATTTADYELWVDEASGLVLRMKGPLSIGDYSPSTAPDGGFTFTELTFEPVTIPDPPEVLPTAQTGEFPPFHMIRNGWPGVVEYWYRDAGMLRETFIDEDDAGWIGTFTVVSNGQLAGCRPHREDPSCFDVPLEDASDIYPLGRPYRQVPLSLVEESCTEVSQDSVAGRPARQFACDGVHFETIPYAETWYAVPDPQAHPEYWYDTEADLLLRTVGTGDDVEATLLELNPAFPVGIFVYEELIFPSESDTG